MDARLIDLQKHFEELNLLISSPDVIADQNRFRTLCEERSKLEPIIEACEKMETAEKQEAESLEILKTENDEEMIALAKEQLSEAKQAKEDIQKEINILLLPKDPRDDKNIIVEIRGGAGGDEAALFAGELYRMYCAYAQSLHWKVEVLSLNENGLGGLKEAIFMVSGKGAYSRFKYESGVHRVQRVPITESSGRIHTSTATVAVMPEASDLDVVVKPEDCRIDIFRSSGAGGQHVNKTSSAIRLTHIPTGIVVECQDERSQLQNKEKAFAVLRSRLYDKEYAEKHEKEANEKKSQIGSGDRSEKIRTYNFPQSRVTDHRVPVTVHNIDEIMNGDLGELLDIIISADQAQKLANLET